MFAVRKSSATGLALLLGGPLPLDRAPSLPTP